jgi:hypothetical protein
MKNLIIAGLLLIFYSFFSLSAQANTAKKFTLINKSGMTITAVYISPAGANKWSDNLDTYGKVTNKSGFLFDQDVDNTSCNYDIKYTTEDGKDYTMTNVDLCKAAAITLINAEGKKNY